MAASALNQMFTPLWQVFDNDGIPLSGGGIFFFDTNDHNLPKNVYIDSSGVTAWPNPIVLNAGGFQPQNYGIFGSGAYYIEMRRSDDRTSELIFSQNDYIPPQVSGSGPVVPSTDIQNFIINPQFSLYGQEQGSGTTSVPSSILNLAPGGWVFIKNDTSSVDNISFQLFTPGQTAVPANPNVFFQYQCNSISSTENLKYLGYRFYNFSDGFGNSIGSGVNTLSGQEVTLQFEGISPTNSSVTISINQYFGPNGSAAVLTTVHTFNLTSEWSSEALGAPFNITFTIPRINGKTIDPNGGDYLEIRWNLPLDTVSQVGITNAGLQDLASFVDFQAVPINQLQSTVSGFQLPAVTSQSNAYLDGGYEVTWEQGATSFSLRPRAGDIAPWATNTAPSGAYIMNGLQYYSAQAYNLAQYLWDTVQNKLPSGTGEQGFTATQLSNVVTATCFSNGTVTTGSAGTSGFSFTQTSNGSSVTPGIAEIGCTNSSDIDPGAYFLINAFTTQYYVWFSLNNLTPDPGPNTAALSGKTGIKVIYTGSEDLTGIATLVTLQLNVAQFRVPDWRGLFVRMPNFGATGVLPGTGQITLTSTGNLSGITFAIVGLSITGAPLTENLAGPNNNTVTSVNSYSAITSITPGGAVATAVSAGIAADHDGLCILQTTAGATALIINGVFGRDPDYATRYAMYTGGATGDNTGSEQQNQNLTHVHAPESPASAFVTVSSGSTDISGSGSIGTQPEIGPSGGNQSNPNNVNANWIIYK